VYPALLPLIRTPRLPVVDWTDAPAAWNGLVRFAERRNLVSARVPSHFKRSLHYANSAATIKTCNNNPYSSCKSYIPIIRHWLAYLNPRQSRGGARAVTSNNDYLFMSMTCWVVHTERKRTFSKKKMSQPWNHHLQCRASALFFDSHLWFVWTSEQMLVRYTAQSLCTVQAV